MADIIQNIRNAIPTWRVASALAIGAGACCVAAILGLIYIARAPSETTQTVVRPVAIDADGPGAATLSLARPQLAIETFLPSQTVTLSPAAVLAHILAQPMIAQNPALLPFYPEWLVPADLAASVRCLAEAVYYEAGGEPAAGQLAVA